MLRGQKVVERGLKVVEPQGYSGLFERWRRTSQGDSLTRNLLHVPSVNTAVSIEIEKECMQQKMLCSTLSSVLKGLAGSLTGQGRRNDVDVAYWDRDTDKLG